MSKVDEKLLKKYSSTGPRYTSYPPATFFDTNFSNEDYVEKLILSNSESPESVSVYIHIPFCPQICHFCGCTTETGFTKPFLERYIDALIKEIEFVSKKIDSKRKLTQVHWGGGTPNEYHINILTELPISFMKLLISLLITRWQLNVIQLT